jgi:hypothetical protein
LKLIINHNNEIIFQTTKSKIELVNKIKELYKNNFMQLLGLFEGLGEIDIYNSFSIEYNENQILIYGDDGIIIFKILELNKIKQL